MRPRVIRIGDGADIEKHRTWNMPAEIIVRWQRQHPGHLVGRVDDFDLWVVETGGEPIGGNKRSVGGCRHECKLLLVIPGCASAHRGCATGTRVYPSSAISLSKSATADLDAQARNPYALSWLWIPGSRGACHRAALCADPLARPGMTNHFVQRVTPPANPKSVWPRCRA